MIENPVPDNFVPSGFPPDAEIAKVYDKDTSEPVVEECSCKGNRPAARPHDEYRKTGHDGWYCCKCGKLIVNPTFLEDTESKPDALVIAAGGVYENENNVPWKVRSTLMARAIDHDSVDWCEVNPDGTFVEPSIWLPLKRPHTPTPKQVYRMADESLLPGWAGCYAYCPTEKCWFWSSVSGISTEYGRTIIEPQDNKWKMGGTHTWGWLPPQHAPQDLPDNFDWRDSLVMVEKGNKDG